MTIGRLQRVQSIIEQLLADDDAKIISETGDKLEVALQYLYDIERSIKEYEYAI